MYIKIAAFGFFFFCEIKYFFITNLQAPLTWSSQEP